MEMQVGSPFELVWRNDELTDPPGERPPGFAAEHRMQSRILALDPPRKLTFAWGDQGSDVSFELAPQGEEVLLTVTHRRLPEPPVRQRIGAGWHAHLDLLVARASGKRPGPFWDGLSRLSEDYEARMRA